MTKSDLKTMRRALRNSIEFRTNLTTHPAIADWERKIEKRHIEVETKLLRKLESRKFGVQAKLLEVEL